MAEAAASPHLPRGLPDEIAIWEILVRLPPKALLRCRVVCRAWCSATSSRRFLVEHHARQPTLPLFYAHNFGRGLDIIPFDHRAGVAAADRLRSVARLGNDSFHPYISCDGFLLLHDFSSDQYPLYVVNPATRQSARLPVSLTNTHRPEAMYPHSPTGDYRMLLSPHDPEADDSYQVYTLGSSQPPRRIEIQGLDVDVRGVAPAAPLLFHGSLHWCKRGMITVFDTTTESFRQMLAPVAPLGPDRFVVDHICGRRLFEMDGILSMPAHNYEFTAVGIWAMQDYETEVWEFKYRVKLPVAELTMQFGECYPSTWRISASWDGDDVLVLISNGERLLQVDMDGKLVASSRRRGLSSIQHRLKQTLVQHTFFPSLECYVVNAWPFIRREDYVVNACPFTQREDYVFNT